MGARCWKFLNDKQCSHINGCDSTKGPSSGWGGPYRPVAQLMFHQTCRAIRNSVNPGKQQHVCTYLERWMNCSFYFILKRKGPRTPTCGRLYTRHLEALGGEFVIVCAVWLHYTLMTKWWIVWIWCFRAYILHGNRYIGVCFWKKYDLNNITAIR